MNKFLLLFLFFGSFAYGQISDTIFVSFNKTVYLSFDSKIDVVDAGSEYLSVRMMNDTKIILQVLDADLWYQTSLFVESNGVGYYFVVEYSEQIKKGIYSYPKKEEKSAAAVLSKKSQDSLLKCKSDSVYLSNSMNVVNRNDRIGNRGVVKYKMGYYLRDIVVIDDKVYLKFEVSNKSNISFKRDLEKFEVINVKRRIKTVSEQIVNLNVLYSYKAPDVVKGKELLYYVVVVDKFVLTNDKKLRVQMWETNGRDLDEEGGRKLQFDVFYDDVLNAKK